MGGALFAPGKNDNGLKLDGVDDYARLQSTFIHQLSDFSISAWVNLEELKKWVRIFDFGTGTNNYMMLTTDNGSGVTFEIKAGGTVQKVATTRRPVVNTWNFYTVTLANNTLSLYFNGILIGKSTTFTLRPYDLGSPANNFIGKSQYTSDPYLKGTVDDFRFFNYALSSSEINNLMEGITSTKDQKTDYISVYPNPAREMIIIKNATGSKLSIYDATGRIISESSITDQQYIHHTHTLKSGYYLIRITNAAGETHQEKLIIR
jgi:hypothetical protein